jgi:nicotinamide mononucleotide (NMN) deamidase PncC
MTAVLGLVEQIHATPHKAVVVVAGAGTQGLAWLMEVPGASRTLLEALVPYGRQSMVQFLAGGKTSLGEEPAQYVSVPTAQAMARAAYRRGMALREDASPVVGLACTATILTDRPKRGDHRCCIAAWDQDGVATYNLVLAKGRRDRAGEEGVVSRLLLHALARACGLQPGLSLELVDTEEVEAEYLAHPNPIQRLLSEDVDLVLAHPDGRLEADEVIPPFRKGGPGGISAVLPGSFNPLHYGHLELAQVAQAMLGAPVAFELSVVNVDKLPLEEAEVRRRLAQFAAQGLVALTRAETFRKKADLLPGCTFVIGWDTAVRLVEPRYYGGQEPAMLAALAEIWALGCRFLVAGREHQGRFHTLGDIPIPQGFQPLFQAIPQSRFRADISSTALRARQQAK